MTATLLDPLAPANPDPPELANSPSGSPAETCLADLAPVDIRAIDEALEAGPSERDLSLHTAVYGEGLSQREAAELFGVSQPRVSMILREVDAWACELGSDPRRDRPPEKRRRLAEYIYRGRLDYFYSRAIKAWDNSQGDQSTTQTLRDNTGVPKTVTRQFYSHGRPAYLTLALRIADRIARLDGVHTGGERPRDVQPNQPVAGLSPAAARGPESPPGLEAQLIADNPVTASKGHSNGSSKGHKSNAPQVIKRAATPDECRELDAAMDRMFADLQRSRQRQ